MSKITKYACDTCNSEVIKKGSTWISIGIGFLASNYRMDETGKNKAFTALDGSEIGPRDFCSKECFFNWLERVVGGGQK